MTAKPIAYSSKPGLFAMTLAGEAVHAITRFEPALVAHFGLPRALPTGP